MTYSNKYTSGGSSGQLNDSANDYPKAFGITLTPTVNGLILGLLGLFGATYIMVSMVIPAQDSNQQLRASKEEKEAQIKQLEGGETDVVLEKLRAKLKQAQDLRLQVLSLFSDERTLDTLLLDLNRFVSFRDAALTSFELKEQEPQVISDGSLGKLVDGKLKRQTINLELEGTFSQTQEILRDIERLQSLLLIRDLSSQVSSKSNYLLQNGKLIIQNPTKLKTSLKAEILMPLSQDELKALAQKSDEKDKKEQKSEPPK